MPDIQQELVCDCLVAGGGLSGLTAAITLSRCGHRVILVDQERFDPDRAGAADGRTTAIAAAGRMMFEALGLWTAIAEQSGTILDIRVSDGESRCFVHYDHREVGNRPMGHIVDNGRIRRVLVDAVSDCPGVEWRTGTAVQDIAADPGHITVRLADGHLVRASLLVAADGRDSRVRSLAGIPVTRINYRQTSMVFCAAHDHPHQGVAHERFLPGGPLALLPMAGNRSSIVWTDREPVIRDLMQLDDATLSQALQTRFGDSLGTFHVVGDRWTFPLSLTVAQRLTADRVAVVGDAAHGLHPIAGQGFNLALRDIAVLAEEVTAAARLGLDIGCADVLRRYRAGRAVDVMTLVAATHTLNQLFSHAGPMLRLARSTGLGAVNRMPRLKSQLMRHAMGLLGERPGLLQGQLP